MWPKKVGICKTFSESKSATRGVLYPPGLGLLSDWPLCFWVGSYEGECGLRYTLLVSGSPCNWSSVIQAFSLRPPLENWQAPLLGVTTCFRPLKGDATPYPPLSVLTTLSFSSSCTAQLTASCSVADSHLHKAYFLWGRVLSWQLHHLSE